MPNGQNCGPIADSELYSNRRGLTWRTWVFGAIMALSAGCTQTGQNAPVAAATPPPGPPPLPAPVPYPDAVLKVANAVFATAPVSAQPGGPRQVVVIDPLVNGITGEQSATTQQIGERLVALAREKYPQFDIQPFSAATVRQGPYVMVGTFTPVNAQGQTAGTREAYRFCLVMLDLHAGKTVAKSAARALPEGVDSTPIGFFRDSPAWSNDASIKSYIDACQATKVGDPINPTYLNGIVTASTISEAINAYDAGHYGDALELYQAAQRLPAGDQLRVYNGIYLTTWKLGHHDEAADAFGRVVDYGLAHNTLGVKILFRPGSTAFEAAAQTTGSYNMWLRQIADHSASRSTCLQVTGNTSPSGSAALNDQLSVLRAEYVKGQLETDAPGLRGHVIAAGAGAKSNLVGTGADDLSDALDRRVDFKVIPTC
jgi:outer membrane protein OmpA-like peptidoglycan-associated protein